MTSGNIMDGLRIDLKKKENLERLDSERVRLREDSGRAITEYKTTLDSMLSGREDVKVEQLSKLDEGIKRSQKFRGEISDLTEDLTTQLNDLGQTFGDMTQYKGAMEKILSGMGLTKYADKKRLSRVKSADVKENLQTILDYGSLVVSRLYDAIIENMECQTRIEASIGETSRKLTVNQPVYEKWRSDREALERQLNEIQTRIDNSPPTQVAEIVGERNALEKRLADAKINEDNYFTIVSKARQALPIQRTHMNAYSDIVRSLTSLRTGLENDIENVTQIYLAVPTAIKTALGTKAASQYDKGMKYATDKATETVLASARGVLDEAQSRQERPLIEAEKLEQYRQNLKNMQAEFNERAEKMKGQYSQAGKNN